MSVSKASPVGVCLLVTLQLMAASVKAQPVWTDKFSAQGITVDWLRPFVKDKSVAGATSITYLSARIPVSGRLRLKPEIPIGYASIEEAGAKDNTAVLGNPYIGLEALGNDGSSTAEIGLRLPTIYDSTPMTQIAQWTDFDRFEAFLPETAAITGSFVGRQKSDGIQMEVAGGVTVLVPFDNNDTDIYGQYAGQLVFSSKGLAFITGISGRILFTESGLTFGQRSTHQAGFSLIGYFGRFRPGVMARIALDKPLRDHLNAVLGINFSYEIAWSRREPEAPAR